MKPENAIKKLGEDTVYEMNAMGETDLKQVIVDANTAMQQAQDEIEANPVYQGIKADLKALTQGKRDLDSRQKARIKYSLELLQRFSQEVKDVA